MSEKNYTVSCPHCNMTFEVPEEYLGQQAECTQCGQPFTLETASPAAAPASPSPAAAPASPSPAAAPENVMVSCSGCGAQYEVPAEYLGQQAECAGCGILFVLQKSAESSSPSASAVPAPTSPDSAPSASAAPPAAEPPASSAPVPTPEPAEEMTTEIDLDTPTHTMKLSRKSISRNTAKPTMAEHFGPYFDPNKKSEPARHFNQTATSAPAPESPEPKKWWQFWKWFQK